MPEYPVYLNKEVWRILEELVKLEGKTKGQIIREAVTERYEQKTKRTETPAVRAGIR